MPSRKRKANEIARDLKKAGKSKGQQKIYFNKRSDSIEGERSSVSLDVSHTNAVDKIHVTDELRSEKLSNEVSDIEKTDASMTDVSEISVDNNEQTNSSPEAQNVKGRVSKQTYNFNQVIP